MATGLLLADDLIFISRIVGTAKDLGLTLHSCRTSDELLDRSEKEDAVCVLLDLHHADLEISEVVARLKSGGGPYIVGYGSHVDAATLKRAREAGCDLVLPRSKFVADLPTSLPLWFQAQG